ncbi:hypothetical protein JTB14_000895 [Gonioctena quinquepunctata]|nr:hypothetical protein JTB14_000895 [Gonioctena quinquepunctata]
MGSDEDLGKELRENNEKIVECIKTLKEQRDELAYIIEKQQEERQKLETEMERITYKLCLINKSLAQRIKAKTCYDNTLIEIENNYAKLVKDSGDLLGLIKIEFENLESMINKKTNTEEQLMLNGSGEQIYRDDKACTCRHKPAKDAKDTKDSSSKANRSVKADSPTKGRQPEMINVASIQTQESNDSSSTGKNVMPAKRSNT